MRLRWIVPIAVLIPLRLAPPTLRSERRGRHVTINPREVTLLHLRPEFESTIRMPEDITSVILGNPGRFKAEHNEGEPEYVYVKPITKDAAQSNLLIATKSGQHVTLELISDGLASDSSTQPVDFLIEYRVFAQLSDRLQYGGARQHEAGWRDFRAPAFQPGHQGDRGNHFRSRSGIRTTGPHQCADLDEVGGQADRDIDR